MSRVGEVVFDVKTERGKQMRRHSNQMRHSRKSLPLSVPSNIVEDNNVKEGDAEIKTSESEVNNSDKIISDANVLCEDIVPRYNLRPRPNV